MNVKDFHEILRYLFQILATSNADELFLERKASAIAPIRCHEKFAISLPLFVFHYNIYIYI